MNVVRSPDSAGVIRPLVDEASEGDLDFDRIIRTTRRQLWVIVGFGLLGAVCGLLYLKNSIPRYTATAVLIIDGSKAKSSMAASIADLTYDSGAIDSQLEVLKSEGTAQSVIAALKLKDDPTFRATPRGPFSQWLDDTRARLGLGGGRDTPSDPAVDALSPAEKEQALDRSLVAQLEANLDVRRVGRSYVIDVDYTSPSRTQAADVANGFARAYIGDQLTARLKSMQTASDWLEANTGKAREKSINADLAVQKFKSDHGLIIADGKLVSDQQLSQLSTQLVTAEGETAKNQAQFEQLQRLISSNDVNAAIAGGPDDPLINGLREKYLTAAQLEKSFAASLGPDNAQVSDLRRSMESYTALIFGEMRRIAEAYRGEADVAKARENTLREALLNLSKQNAVTNQMMVQLRVLEGEADGLRHIYATSLQRLQDLQERQSFPETEARIITTASAPLYPTYPKQAMVMVFWLLCGGMAGVGAGALREYRDRVFRTAGDVRDGLHLEFLGILPSVGRLTFKQQKGVEPELNHIGLHDPLLRYCVDYPTTRFAETLRSMKVAVDLGTGQRKPKIVGIVSVSPNEGKTTVSKNFASLLAQFGEKVLLIDGDLSQRGLTTALAANAEAGLLEVMSGEKSLQDVLKYEPSTGLAFLPAVASKRLVHSSHILSSPGMQKLVQEAGTMFNYIIMDLPPAGPVVGVRAAAFLFDGFIFVVEWGRTVRDMFRTTLLNDKELGHKCIGVVYNKVNMNRIKLYERAETSSFHHQFEQYF